MNGHELARRLLDLPDLPVAITAMGHTYLSDQHADSHGDIEIADMASARIFSRQRYVVQRYVVIGHSLKWAGGACPEWGEANPAERGT